MTNGYFRHPAKRVDKVYRELGATRDERTKDGVKYRFPDGARLFVPSSLNPTAAADMVKAATAKYGHTRPDIAHTEQVRGADRPDLDLDRVVASTHAKERWELMHKQAGLTMQEIMMALRIPQKVLWSDPHGAWLWVGDRVAVAASIDRNGITVIRTLLWTTAELWAEHPRPEHVPA